VADGDLALLREIDLDELDDPRREFVRLEDLVDLILRALTDPLDAALALVDQPAELLVDLTVGNLECREVEFGEVQPLDDIVGEGRTLGEVRLHRAALQEERD